MSIQQDPDKFRRNAQGHLVPIDKIKDIDRLRDDLVLNLIARVNKLHEQMSEFKAEVASEIDAFLELSAREYDTPYGGKKGNVTLRSFDGRYMVKRNIADREVFDERLQVAKELIDQCLHEWTADSRSEVQALVEHAFQTDKEGKVSLSRVLQLRQVNITDEKWQKAMHAIADARQVIGSAKHLNFYERESEDGPYRHIPLDIAKL
ncbi:MAG: sulfate transporter [Marinobacter sp.]|nr:MAG: sulfate transporter [Marinobacter sp.]